MPLSPQIILRSFRQHARPPHPLALLRASCQQPRSRAAEGEFGVVHVASPSPNLISEKGTPC